MDEKAVEILAQIQRSLQVIAGAMAKAPNIKKPLGDFLSFDWSSIGAQVLRQDDDGVSIVEHNGQIYKRRAPDNKFEACIWYSRCTGKDESGDNKYETLISFETIKDDVEPLGSKARKAIQSQRKTSKPPAPKQTAPTPPTASENNVLPIQPKRLTAEEMDIRAGRLVADGCVNCIPGSKCVVKANDKISYDVTRQEGKLACECERFGLQQDCEHVRAVRLHFSPAKPDGRAELVMLIADVLSAGGAQEMVNGVVAKLCDGLYDPAQLNDEQVAKARRALQFKLEELNAQRKAA